MQELESQEEDTSGDSSQISVWIPENKEDWYEASDDIDNHQESPWE